MDLVCSTTEALLFSQDTMLVWIGCQELQLGASGRGGEGWQGRWQISWFLQCCGKVVVPIGFAYPTDIEGIIGLSGVNETNWNVLGVKKGEWTLCGIWIDTNMKDKHFIHIKVLTKHLLWPLLRIDLVWSLSLLHLWLSLYYCISFENVFWFFYNSWIQKCIFLLIWLFILELI